MRVQLVSRVEPAAEPAVALTLAQAVLKGDKMDDVVRDAVMLGVAAVQPLVTTRTEIDGRRADAGRARRSLAARRAGVGEAVEAGGAAGDPAAADARAFLGDPPPAVRDARGTGAGQAGRARGEAGRARARCPCYTASRFRRTRRSLLGPKAAGPRRNRVRARSRRSPDDARQRTLRADATPVAAISVLQFLFGRPLETDLLTSEILGPDVAFAEAHARRRRAVLVEVGRVEPLALF